MLILPLIVVFNGLSQDTTLRLYDVSHISIFLVMLVRPLADILTNAQWVRPLVILRKGVGVLSASVVVSFIFAKIIVDATGYFASFGTASYWSLTNLALFAHLADISAVILLITSNNLSKKLLGTWWKRVQKLSYIYFYSSALYVYVTYGTTALLYAMIIITTITLFAYFKNRQRAVLNSQTI